MGRRGIKSFPETQHDCGENIFLSSRRKYHWFVNNPNDLNWEGPFIPYCQLKQEGIHQQINVQTHPKAGQLNQHSLPTFHFLRYWQVPAFPLCKLRSRLGNYKVKSPRMQGRWRQHGLTRGKTKRRGLWQTKVVPSKDVKRLKVLSWPTNHVCNKVSAAGMLNFDPGLSLGNQALTRAK